MIRTVGAGVGLILVSSLVGCATSPDETTASASSSISGGVSVQAQEDVMVSGVPGGDVVEGTLAKGSSTTALCFLRDIVSSAALVGSAIKVESANFSGYAFVTDLPRNSTDRKMLFNLNIDALDDRLPPCPR
jgi:hypothetical protein